MRLFILYLLLSVNAYRRPVLKLPKQKSLKKQYSKLVPTDCRVLSFLNTSIPLDCCNTTASTCDTNNRVFQLDLSYQQLSGNFPTDLFTLTELTSLSLAFNQISGSIPLDIDKLTQLSLLDLSSNRLSGAISPNIGKLPLVSLDLSYNLLNSTIPGSFKNLSLIKTLNLGSNRLVGIVPSEFKDLVRLESMDLRRNRLSGEFPSLAKLVNLNYLDLSKNSFNGTVIGLGELVNLVTISLANNRFSGHFPNEIFTLRTLSSVDFGTNLFSGTLSPQQNTSINRFVVSNNQLQGSFSWISNHFPQLYELQIDKNNFTGEILNEDIAFLPEISILNIAKNNFSGQLPSNLGNLSLLSQLDISYNSFSGPLPESILDLPYLFRLFLQWNQFSGPFPNLSNLGNLAVCNIAHIGDTCVLNININYNWACSGSFLPVCTPQTTLIYKSNLEHPGSIPTTISSEIFATTTPSITPIPSTKTFYDLISTSAATDAAMQTKSLATSLEIGAMTGLLIMILV